MKEELNRDRLRAAIDQLPTYSPEEEIWDRLETELEADVLREDYLEKHPEQLRQAVAQLPHYSAPTRLWRKIERRLPSRLLPNPWIGRVAAAMLVLALAGGTGWWLLREPKAPNVEVSETLNPSPALQLAPAQELYWGLLAEQEPALAACLEGKEAPKGSSWGEVLQPLIELLQDETQGEEAKQKQAQLVQDLIQEHCSEP
jgi:DNA-binding transcriptional LysR family regulator